MRNPGGYFVITDPDHPLVERDTFRCAHCGGTVIVALKASPSDMGGWCFCCSAAICPRCTGKDCVPLERQLQASEARDRFRRQLAEVYT